MIKYEITIEEFINRYGEKEFNKMFEYISFMKEYMAEKDRHLKEIKTQVFNTKGEYFDVGNYCQINGVGVYFEERICYAKGK